MRLRYTYIIYININILFNDIPIWIIKDGEIEISMKLGSKYVRNLYE